jgi:hypothetical protein
MVKVEVLKGLVHGKTPGAILEMSEKDAESLMALGVVQELGSRKQKESLPPSHDTNGGAE